MCDTTKGTWVRWQEYDELRVRVETLDEAIKSVLSWDYIRLVTEDHIDGDGLCRSLDALAVLVKEEEK